jgi:hypothetical protein
VTPRERTGSSSTHHPLRDCLELNQLLIVAVLPMPTGQSMTTCTSTLVLDSDLMSACETKENWQNTPSIYCKCDEHDAGYMRCSTLPAIKTHKPELPHAMVSSTHYGLFKLRMMNALLHTLEYKGDNPKRDSARPTATPNNTKGCCGNTH